MDRPIFPFLDKSDLSDKIRNFAVGKNLSAQWDRCGI